MIYMYKGNHIHSNDLKFNPTELKKKPEAEKEANRKDYEIIRKLVKGNRQTDEEQIISQV